MSTLKRYQAEDFFVGRKLKIAKAIEEGDMPQVRKLAPGDDLSASGDKGMTLMWFAMLPGIKGHPNYEAVKTLVSLGVDPATQIAEGIGSALDYTFITRDDPNDRIGLRFLQAMLDGGMPVNKVNDSGTTLLHKAAGPGGTVEHVKLLLQRGADVNAHNSIGATALDEAVDTLKPDIALHLVRHGARVNTQLTNGSSTAYAVLLRLERLQPGPVRTQFEQLRDLMISKGAKWPPDPPEVVREQLRARGQQPVAPPGPQR